MPNMTPQQLYRMRRYLPRVAQLRIRNFSDGLNLRDWQGGLAATATPDAYNVTVDERGTVGSRLGMQKWNNTPYEASLGKNGYYWAAGQKLIVQYGTSLYVDTSNTPVKTFTTNARVGFADFLGKLHVIHPVDGLWVSPDATAGSFVLAGQMGTVTVTIASPAVFTFTNHGLIAGDQITLQTTGALPTGLTAGTTYYVISAGLTANNFEVSTTAGGTAVNTSGTQAGTHTLFRAETPKGSILIAWQNVLLSDDSTAQARLRRCKIGDSSNWGTGTGEGAFNDIREKDGEALVAFAGATGTDFQGRPSLLVFKKRSFVRVYDVATLAYQTIDWRIGAASALSVVPYFGKTAILSEIGMFVTDGINPCVPVSQQLEPLWTAEQVALDQTDLWCAGVIGDRVFFSLPRAGQTANNLALEYHPQQGWIVPGSQAAAFYVTYQKQTRKLLTGSPTVNGQVYEQRKGGTDDGVAIHSWFQSAWVEPGEGSVVRLLRLKPYGRGDFTIYKKTDYDVIGQGSGYAVSISRGGFTWNSFNWNDPAALWGPTIFFAYGDPILDLGTCRSVCFRIDATTSTTSSGPPLLGSGTAPETGAWALQGLDLFYVPLGEV